MLLELLEGKDSDVQNLDVWLLGPLVGEVLLGAGEQLLGLCGAGNGEVQGLTVRSPGPLVCEVLLELLEGEDGEVKSLVVVRIPGPLVVEELLELLDEEDGPGPYQHIF